MVEKLQYILVLGSNIEPEQNLRLAIKKLKSNKINVITETAVLLTAPESYFKQAAFLNQALLIASSLKPLELLKITQSVEKMIGRKKRNRNEAREIDIDIVWYSGGSFESSKLQIPHRFNRTRYWVRQFIAELKRDQIDTVTRIKLEKFNHMAVKTAFDFIKKKKIEEKITMVTCYDHATAKILAETSVDAILVGDSLGSAFQGNSSTMSVKLDDIIYHTKWVKGALPDKFVIADLPFKTYQLGNAQALEAAGTLVQKTGCDAVKLEGTYLEEIEAIIKMGIPVMGHLGLTPQSMLALGGHRVQSKSEESRKKLLEDALSLQTSGVFSIVLEVIPREVAAEVSKKLKVPTIGIGAGNDADGQVLVINDLLGLDPNFTPKFLRRYADLHQVINEAVENYCLDVREKSYPNEEESYNL